MFRLDDCIRSEMTCDICLSLQLSTVSTMFATSHEPQTRISNHIYRSSINVRMRWESAFNFYQNNCMTMKTGPNVNVVSDGHVASALAKWLNGFDLMKRPFRCHVDNISKLHVLIIEYHGIYIYLSIYSFKCIYLMVSVEQYWISFPALLRLFEYIRRKM